MENTAQINIYSCIELQIPCDASDSVKLTDPDGCESTLEAFELQNIDITYDTEGTENISAKGAPLKTIRFFPDKCGIYRIDFSNGNFKLFKAINCKGRHGYVETSKKDSRYLAYTDGTSFFPIGINLAFISPIGKSNGKEFGISDKFQYLGLRQYERWFKALSKYGVNMARIWLGHEYFCPDTEQAEVFDLKKFAVIDKLIALAEKYKIVLKLTIEQFRYFDYERVADSNSYDDDVFRKFNKRLYKNKRRCESAAEWLSDKVWKAAWLEKMHEFSKRISGNPTVMAIELWNEMNCMPMEHLYSWNEEMLPKVKAMFPRHLVINSLGSLDCDGAAETYRSFCWQYSDMVQIHRYLDCGAQYEICHDTPAKLLRDGIIMMQKSAGSKKPILVAETGAVNNCHSGPFKYYCCDHNGIIFCDAVYSPVFCYSAGCGNIWHWDDRYVESKNLYKYYKPLADLCSEINFDEENFKDSFYEDDDVLIMFLKGNKTTLGYIRNKSDSWQNVLRDLKEIQNIPEKHIRIDIECKNFSVIDIWNDETGSVSFDNRNLNLVNIKHGMFFKALS